MKKVWLFVGLVVAIIGAKIFNHFQTTPSPAQEAAVAQLNWLTDFNAAQERSSAEKKLILINFTGSDWCPPCMRLRKEVFSQPEFAAYAKERLVLLDVDFPRRKQLSASQQSANESLARRFGIESFPTIVMLNSDGKELGRLGYTPGGVKAFTGKIEQLLPLAFVMPAAAEPQASPPTLACMGNRPRGTPESGASVCIRIWFRVGAVILGQH